MYFTDGVFCRGDNEGFMENFGDNKCPTEVPADEWKYHLAHHGWLDAGESLKINCV